MSDELMKMLGFDPEGETIERASHLAENDLRLTMELASIRQGAGLSSIEVAERMGFTVEQVEDFEAYWHDPTLSELRRYALAIGATYTTEVSIWGNQDEKSTVTGVGIITEYAEATRSGVIASSFPTLKEAQASARLGAHIVSRTVTVTPWKRVEVEG